MPKEQSPFDPRVAFGSFRALLLPNTLFGHREIVDGPDFVPAHAALMDPCDPLAPRFTIVCALSFKKHEVGDPSLRFGAQDCQFHYSVVQRFQCRVLFSSLPSRKGIPIRNSEFWKCLTPVWVDNPALFCVGSPGFGPVSTRRTECGSGH